MRELETVRIPADVRVAGFAHRVPLRRTLAWVDTRTTVLAPETVPLESAVGRVSSAPVVSGVDWPGADCAAVDGYAMRAADSAGAGDYNPLSIALVEAWSARALPPGAAALVAAGMPLPAGADAVLASDAAQRSGVRTLDVLAPVAQGAGVDRRGSELRAGAEIVAGLARLRSQDVALLVLTRVACVAVVRRPRVCLVVPGPKTAGQDALTPMLRALVARDGGTAETAAPADAGRTALAQAMARAAAGADLVLVAGRTGVGADDEAPLAVAEAGGSLEVHGIAMRPGGSVGLGMIGAVPVLLLPGAPLACLAAYDVLAARAVRRMGGLQPLPYAAVDAVLDRKIVSAVGFTDLVRVQLAEGRATPLASAESGGLASAVRADGFVIVSEASEGHAPGSTVRVHLYRDRCEEAGA